MNYILDKLQQLALNRLTTRLKHLRGRHDQLDHAWNRGMGRGGGGAALAPNQMGPLPTTDFYRQRRIELMEQQRQGQITNAEMRRQMRDLRGITVDALESNQESDLVLANRRGSPKPSPFQMAFDFDNPSPVITPSVSSTPSPTPIPLRQRSIQEIKDEIKQIVSPDVINSSKAVYRYDRRATKYYHDHIVLSATNGPDSKEAKNAMWDYRNMLMALQRSNRDRMDAGFEQDFLKVLNALKHEDPQTVIIDFPASWKQDEIERVARIIKAVIALAPMQASRRSLLIRVQKMKGSNAQYTPMTRTMKLGNADADTIAHETIHVMQHQLGWGMRASHDFGDQRTKGENPVPLKSYNYGEGKSFLDATDDPYTFKMYPGLAWGMERDCEVLPKAIETLLHIDEVQDQEWIDLLIQVIKDGGV